MGTSSRRGQGNAEYGLILVLIGIFAILTAENFGYSVRTLYTDTAGRTEQVANGQSTQPSGQTTR